jgi:hypothetical protein
VRFAEEEDAALRQGWPWDPVHRIPREPGLSVLCMGSEPHHCIVRVRRFDPIPVAVG